MTVTNHPESDPAPADPVPALLHNGTVHSTAEPYAEAMLVDAGQVAWLGSDETADRLAQEHMVRQDLDRALVAPAFVGSVRVTAEEAESGALAAVLDVAARDLGYAALRLHLAAEAAELSTEQSRSSLAGRLRQALRTAQSHPVQIYPILELGGVRADGGAPSIAPVNTALDLLGELDRDSTHPLSLQLDFAAVAPNLLGVRSWCAEAGRQLMLSCSDAEPAAVVDAMVVSQQHLRDLKQTPSPATPTVLVGFDSQDAEHWQALLNTGAHVLLDRPGHLATALRVGVPTAAAPQEGQNPWQLVSAHVHHPEDPVSVRAGFNAQTRGAYRSLVGAPSGAGQLNPGSSATFAVWEVDQLAVQTPNSTAAAWSTDTRARTPLLPYLDGETLPGLLRTVIQGQSL